MAAHRSRQVTEYETLSVLMLQETERAYLVADDDCKEFWIPKSVSEVKEINTSHEMIVKLPTWIREKNDEDFVRMTREKFAVANRDAYLRQQAKLASWRRAMRSNTQ